MMRPCYVIDKDDYETIESLLISLNSDVKNCCEEGYCREELLRKIDQLWFILGFSEK